MQSLKDEQLPLLERLFCSRPRLSGASGAVQVLLSTPAMVQNALRHGSDLIILDCTHSVDTYGYPLLTVLLADQFGSGRTVFLAWLQDESQATFEEALAAFVCTVRHLEGPHESP